jgi:hypothetical protein
MVVQKENVLPLDHSSQQIQIVTGLKVLQAGHAPALEVCCL